MHINFDIRILRTLVVLLIFIDKALRNDMLFIIITIWVKFHNYDLILFVLWL